jgi:hypothetical protein
LSERTRDVRNLRVRPPDASLVRWYWPTFGVALHGLADLNATETPLDSASARGVAERLLRGIDTRLAHSARVAAQADRVRQLLDSRWGAVISDAAWLHDVGYSPPIACSGFHPLDGARWLRDQGWPEETCRLVAWHTAARVEGKLRGLDQELSAEFKSPPELATNALTWADLTSSPSGERWTVARRLADILRRYLADPTEHRAIADAAPALWHATREIESRLTLQIEVP